MKIRWGEALGRTLPPTPTTRAAWPAQHWKTRMAGTTAVGLNAKSGLTTGRADGALLNLVFEPFDLLAQRSHVPRIGLSIEYFRSIER